jgi:hypothetical protein
VPFWSRKRDEPDPATPPAPLGPLAPDPEVPEPEAVGPVDPGPGWATRVAEGTGLTLWVQPVDDPASGVRRWEELAAAHPATGLWPVLVGPAFWEAVEIEPTDVEQPPTTGAQWLSATLEDTTYGESPLAGVGRGPQPPLDPAAVGVADLADGLEELVLVPASAGWRVPELLGWDGAVNQDVMGREHTAVLRRWAGRYGVRLLGLTRDEVVLRVDRPPVDAAAALGAAVELFGYCHDAVWQGSETLEALTPMTVCPAWRLWWD